MTMIINANGNEWQRSHTCALAIGSCACLLVALAGAARGMFEHSSIARMQQLPFQVQVALAPT